MDASPKLLERIAISRETLKDVGIPTIRDSQISIEHVLVKMVEGETRETILEQHPSLEPEDLQATLLYAYHAVKEHGTISAWVREVDSKRRRDPEEIEAKKRAIHEAVDKATQYHQSHCPYGDECQCSEDDIDVMLEQIERGRGIIP